MIVELPFPPSVNAMFFNVPGRGRVKTTDYKAWELEAGLMLRRQKPTIFSERVEISVDLDETRRGDADNRFKAVADLLVKHGVIPDDSKRYVKRVSIGWESGVSGCRVQIKPVDDTCANSPNPTLPA